MEERGRYQCFLCLTEGEFIPYWGSIFTVYQKVLIYSDNIAMFC